MDGIKHGGRVNRLIVEPGQKLSDNETDEGAIFEIVGGLKRHERSSMGEKDTGERLHRLAG